MKIVKSGALIAITFILLCFGASHGLASMYAYIPNTGSDSIAVVDMEGPSIIAEVAVENAPTGIVVTPDGQYVFSANSLSGTVSVIQTSQIATSQDEVIDTISVGGELGGMAMDKEAEYVYVVSRTNDKVIKLDISDPETVVKRDSIDVGSNPQGVAVFHNGEKIFVTNADDDTVSVVESDATTVIGVGDSPAGIVASTYGDYVYVANEGDGTISVIDGANLYVVTTITVESGPYALALASWDSYLYVANAASGTVSIINALTFSVREQGVVVGSSPSGLSVPKNGSDAYVIDSTDNTLTIVDLEGKVTTLDNTDLNTSNITDLNSPMGLGNFMGGDGPEAPTDLTIDNVGEESFRITWEDNSWTEEGFKLEIKNHSHDEPEFNLFAVIIDPGTTDSGKRVYWVKGLNDDTKYSVRLAAYTEAADSEFTSAVTATTDDSDDDDDDDDDDETDCFIKTLF